ncbi:hypothetical protein M758_9G157800 [Ceratodon purpureus]|nr:hypothetical protein M758_9G157800 [Ceratodon purpureus]
MGRLGQACVWQLVLYLVSFVSSSGAYVGINYGRNGDNLPVPTQTVQLLKNLGIEQVRIYDTDPTVLSAFQNSNIQLVIGIPNVDLLDLATSNTSASTWVTTRVLPFLNSTNIYAVSVGNEVLTGYQSASPSLVPAMNNIYAALIANNVQSIKVSSPCSMNLLAQSFYPSSGAFNGSYTDVTGLLDFLSRTSSPFMVNVYPWKAYAADPSAISVDYALFNTNSSNGVLDMGTNLTYTNLFDAQVDAVYAALIKANHSELIVLVSETGWPTAGDTGEAGASITNAQTYNANLVKHIADRSGTPVRPGTVINTYLYEVYNENQNVGPSSQKNFGIFNNDSTAIYALNISGSNNVTSGVGQRSWCIAKDGVSEAVLQTSIDFACGVGGVDCTPINANGTCFLPDTRYSHASWAINAFYVNSTDGIAACNFQGAARITTSDPSYGTCTYPASTSTPIPNGGIMLKSGFSSAQLFSQLVFLVLAMSFWR